MSADLEDRLRDVAVWYYENKDRIPHDNLAKRLDFMGKAISCIFELVAIQAKDVQVMEQRHPRNRLFLPTGVQLTGEQNVKLR